MGGCLWERLSVGALLADAGTQSRVYVRGIHGPRRHFVLLFRMTGSIIVPVGAVSR